MRKYIDLINESQNLNESRNVECDIIEWKPGAWYYAFERFESEDGKYNWRDEDVDCYGPFASQEEAESSLVNDHANPGGHTVWNHAEVASSSDEIKRCWAYWVQHAESPRNRGMSGGRWW